MAARSLAATLALAFGGTTLAVFALGGSYVYFELDSQVTAQNDVDILLAARHARRLAQELDSPAGVREHADRLISVVLGNQALSMEIADRGGNVLAAHNVERTAAPVPAASSAPAAALRTVPPFVRPVPASDSITASDIVEWHWSDGTPIRSLAVDAALRDHEIATIEISRNTRDRKVLLDHHRMRLFIASVVGALMAMFASYPLIRASLRSLRDMATNTASVTVDKLDTRIATSRVPRELEALVASLNAMLARLQGGFQRLSQFTADLAHDMRTPLANMRGATEVALARPRSTDEYQALLASNLEECDRLSRMIENVLFLARAEHPQFVTNMRAFDVTEELGRIAAYFEGLAEEAGSVLTVTGDGHLSADLDLFRRAVSNLLANALRYTPRGGQIVLEAAESADALRVTVANQGPRIEAAHLERIFDRFYRADPSRSSQPQAAGDSGSAGLGLAIVRTVMELHGGTVHAESDETGTRFILTFAHRQHRHERPT